LLSNILLDDLDKELERHGHRFCRYADDGNGYVKSARAGERVRATLKRFLTSKLRLKVNEAQSPVTRPWEAKFLGHGMTVHRQPRLKDKVRQPARKGRGRNLERFIEQDLNPGVRGWANYDRKATTHGVFEDLDGWLRRKPRCLSWRRWKRVYTRARRLIALGFTEAKAWRCACDGRGPWWNAGSSHMHAAYPAATFQRMGRVSLLATVKTYA
jgi:RNA-directed DNA polymerase